VDNSMALTKARGN